MDFQFNQLKIAYKNSFREQRAKIKYENCLYEGPRPHYPANLFSSENRSHIVNINTATEERKHIVATLAKIFDFLDSVFSAEDFRSRLNKNSLEYLQEEGRNLNRLLTAVNDDLLSKANKSIKPDTLDSIEDPIQEDPMYKDIWETSQKLLAFLNGGFEAFFKQVEHLLPNPPNQAQAERKEARP